MIEDINILTFDVFIQKIKTIKTYRSNANKEYKVVKVNKTALVLRDQRTKADFEVPAAQVFAAMKELGIENCTVLKMRQYVGTHAAPASAALIFWAFGRGQVQAAIKKFADLTVRIIRGPLVSAIVLLPLRKISQNFSISCISIIITKILSVIIIFSIRQLIPHQKL